MITCPRCKTENPQGSFLCMKCRTTLSNTRKKPSKVSTSSGSPKFHLSPAGKAAIVLGSLVIVSILAASFTGEKDPCEDVICVNECYGMHLWKMKCFEGECVKDYILEMNSTECGYTPPVETQPPEPEKDTDQDGIPDSADECHNPGCTLVNPSGCPKDSDGDGLQDCYDDCPSEYGEKTNKGCPVEQGHINIEICRVNFNASGNDNYNLNGEWVRICNTGNQDVVLTGWKVYDNAYKEGKCSDHIFYFPSGFVLRAGQSVTIYSGSGIDSGSSLYWGRIEGEYGAIWTNTGDCAYLEDDKGTLVDMYCQ
jgi:hypothetical protein